tara:strand:+ start:284 stop:559 length:276 start_codon:yes stop_codon:yes gene_type:complete
MTLKVVPIQSKMKEPTLTELLARLDSLFNNQEIRGAPKINVVLTSLGFCLWTLNEILDHDEAKFQELVNEVLDKYLPYDGQQASFLTPEDE